MAAYYFLSQSFLDDSEVQNIVNTATETLMDSHKWRAKILQLEPSAAKFASSMCLVNSFKRLKKSTNQALVSFIEKLENNKVSTGAFQAAFPLECAISAFAYFLTKFRELDFNRDIFSMDYFGQLSLGQTLQDLHMSLNKDRWITIWTACRLDEKSLQTKRDTFEAWYKRTKAKDKYEVYPGELPNSIPDLGNCLYAYIQNLSFNAPATLTGMRQANDIQSVANAMYVKGNLKLYTTTFDAAFDAWVQPLVPAGQPPIAALPVHPSATHRAPRYRVPQAEGAPVQPPAAVAAAQPPGGGQPPAQQPDQGQQQPAGPPAGQAGKKVPQGGN